MSSEHRNGARDDKPVDVAALQAELAEAKRISAWLYRRAPAGLRRHLGDVSEWPWLLDRDSTALDEVPARQAGDDPVRDQAVLRAFAELQAGGEDVYFAAEYIASLLQLNPEEFDAALCNLITDKLVEGGKTFRRSYVERVTDAGMAAAGFPGARKRGT